MRWVLRAALVAVGVSSLTAVGVLGSQALSVRTALSDAADSMEDVVDSLAEGDVVAARAAAARAADDTRRATETTDGPLWGLAVHVPVYGDDVAAVREVSGIAHRLTGHVLPRAVTVADRWQSGGLWTDTGGFDLGRLVAVRDDVVAADEELQRLTVRAHALDPRTLVAPLAEAVGDLQGRVSEAAELSSTGATAVRLLPPMLGEDGERRYLVLFQNNAEIRATGGIPGAVAVLTAESGRLRLEKQGTVRDLGWDVRVGTELTADEQALFGDDLASYGADVGMTPDFPRVAELAGARWQHVHGGHVDGVLATDPTALGYLLDGTGPVRLRDGSDLTGGNAASRLLNEIYLTEPDEDQQDAFFAGAARSVFRHVLAGSGDPDGMLDAVARSVREGRLLAWSRDTDEQREIARTRIGGVLPAESIGVFLNDGTAAKMQYYLDHRVDVTTAGCTDDGRAVLDVLATLTSTAPEDAARLPGSVVGWRRGEALAPRIPRGHMRLNVHVYAPVGGTFGSLRVDGQEAPLSLGRHLGHPVGSQTVQLAPGETRRLSYRITTPAGLEGSPVLRVTPGVGGSGVGTVGEVSCDAD